MKLQLYKKDKLNIFLGKVLPLLNITLLLVHIKYSVWHVRIATHSSSSYGEPAHQEQMLSSEHPFLRRLFS